MQLEQVEQVDERAPGYFARMIEKALLFALGISIALATLAQTPSVDDIDAAIKVRGEHIDKISRQISAAGVSNSDLDGWLDTLIGYQGDFNTYADQLQAALAVPAGKLNELGPPPADGQPPESADITRTRKQLTDQVSRLDGLSKRVHLEDGSIGQLIGRARSLQRDRYMSSIQTRSALPFSAQHWATASADVEPVLSRFSGHFEDVWRDQRAAGTLTANVVLLLMALGLAVGLSANQEPSLDGDAFRKY